MSELPQYVANGLLTGAIYALMALGLTIIFGYMNVVNFAHGALYVFGAYLGYSFALWSGLGFFAALVGAAVGTGLMGAAIERGLLEGSRRSSPVMMPMLITIGLAVFLQNLALVIWGPNPKRLASPVHGDTVDLGIAKLAPQQLFVAALALALILAVHAWLQRTRFGLAMRATFQDDHAAWLAGVNVKRMYGVGFGLGAGLAGMAGVLVASIFSLTPNIGELATSKAFAIVILGGLGSFPGAVAGGVLLGLAESLTSGYISSGYADAVAMAVVLVALAVRPEGLYGVRLSVRG
jgi:branched-chain amino acid transport system permease protein